MKKSGVVFFALGSALLLAFAGFLLAEGVLAAVGVGIGVGKIIVDQPLKPGVIYQFPSIIVINTGDEPAEYTTSVEYHADQEQNPEMGLRPPAEWFAFEPAVFQLAPGQSKSVEVKVTLPIKGVRPGKYFAYLQAQPVQKSEEGLTLIRVAAATKLWFTVVPSSWWMGLYWRVLSLYQMYGQWVRLAFGVVIFAVLFTLFRKFFSFNIQLKRSVRSAEETRGGETGERAGREGEEPSAGKGKKLKKKK